MTDPNRTMIGTSPIDPNKTVMGTAPTSYEATVTIKPVQCPVCKTFNPGGVMFCVECGLIFDKALEGDAFGAPAVQLPVLVDESGKEHPIRPGKTTLGRQGDILVEDTRASRKHAEINSANGELTITDLGSTNGTTVDGNKIVSATNIYNGAKISMGGYTLTLGMPGEANKTLAAMSGKTSAMDIKPTESPTVAWLIFGQEEIELSKGKSTFGRKQDHPVCIPDPYVSGTHGEIEIDDTGLYLTDTGSTNGTYINSAKLSVGQKTKVSPEDVVQLGQLEISFKFKD